MRLSYKERNRDRLGIKDMFHSRHKTVSCAGCLEAFLMSRVGPETLGIEEDRVGLMPELELETIN